MFVLTLHVYVRVWCVWSSAGLSATLIFLCVLVHAAFAYSALSKVRRFVRSKPSRLEAVVAEFGPRNRAVLTYLGVFWVWMIYMNHTHRCGL